MADHAEHKMHSPYWGLGIEMVIDFVIMYLVMYTMIATLDHFFLNINNVYMTLMMVAPMALVMLVGMYSMFPSHAEAWAFPLSDYELLAVRDAIDRTG